MGAPDLTGNLRLQQVIFSAHGNAWKQSVCGYGGYGGETWLTPFFVSL